MIKIKFLVFLLLLIVASQSTVIVDEVFGNVTNGRSYSKSVGLTFPPVFYVPDNAKIVIDSTVATPTLYIKKKINYYGHPYSPISIKRAGAYWGVASKVMNDTTHFATFGEWDNMEGFAKIDLIFVVNSTYQVLKKKGLRGKRSIAYYDAGFDWLKDIDNANYKECYWFGPLTPKSDWLRSAELPVSEEVVEPFLASQFIIREHEENELIITGSSFEKTVITPRKNVVLVVPENAHIKHSGEITNIEIYLGKRLGFVGHPPYPVNIRMATDYFGLATKEVSDTLKIGTFGEWHSIEGGASIDIVITFPKGTKIVKESQLSGRESIAFSEVAVTAFMENCDSPQFKKCYWYTGIEPGEGWMKLKTLPDLEHVAGRVK